MDEGTSGRHSAVAQDERVLTERHLVRVRADETVVATLFLPVPGVAVTGHPVVIGGATAVAQRYYARFAEYLAASGRPTLTFDYRGIAQSAPLNLSDSHVRFRDWGIIDVPAVLEWTAARFNTPAIDWVGHSYGGFATGLAHNNHLICRQFAVSSMVADIRLLRDFATQVSVATQLFVLGPIVAHTLGYVPGRFVGGVGLPKHAALEWGRWVRTKDFMFGAPDLPELRYFTSLMAPVCFAFTDDDAWVSEKGVRRLAQKYTVSPERSIWKIPARQFSPGRPIGHIGFFRSEFAATLWPETLAWLDGRKTLGEPLIAAVRDDTTS